MTTTTTDGLGCDKASADRPCDGGELTAVQCECGKFYRRCQAHGGEKGARRSMHSHKAALFCPVVAGRLVKTEVVDETCGRYVAGSQGRGCTLPPGHNGGHSA